ncbi:MAG TPA: hypothetical protein VGS21_00855, partial [Acidimicrobiales bacterium]|nr:hypothetical protein [Acidimicrobiales bacterium]
GDAKYKGSEGNHHLNKPIVAMASTVDGLGYWMVAADGGIFTFGDAKYKGSEGGSHLNSPIVGMAVAPGGQGYWMVAADGGIFTFGLGAHYLGSAAPASPSSPIVSMDPAAAGVTGYWMAAADGAVYPFGELPLLR